MVQPTFFINSTDVIGVVLTAITNNITGSIFLTLLMILMFLIALCFAGSIPIEWTIIIMLPFLLYLMAYSSDFLQIAGFALMYLGILFAKTWFANK